MRMHLSEFIYWTNLLKSFNFFCLWYWPICIKCSGNILVRVCGFCQWKERNVFCSISGPYAKYITLFDCEDKQKEAGKWTTTKKEISVFVTTYEWVLATITLCSNNKGNGRDNETEISYSRFFSFLFLSLFISCSYC